MITQVTIPSLMRVKSGTIDRLGLYLKRSEHTPVLLLVSQGLVPDYLGRVHQSLAQHEIDCLETAEVGDASFEKAAKQERLWTTTSNSVSCTNDRSCHY